MKNIACCCVTQKLFFEAPCNLRSKAHCAVGSVNKLSAESDEEHDMCLVQFTGLVSAFSIHGLQTVHHTGHMLTVILKELLRLVLRQ